MATIEVQQKPDIIVPPNNTRYTETYTYIRDEKTLRLIRVQVDRTPVTS